LFLINIVKSLDSDNKLINLYSLANLLILVILVPTHPPTFIFLTAIFLLHYVTAKVLFLERKTSYNPKCFELLALPVWIGWLMMVAANTKSTFSEILLDTGKYKVVEIISAGIGSGVAEKILANSLALLIFFVSLYQIAVFARNINTPRAKYDYLLASYTIVFLFFLSGIFFSQSNFVDRPLSYLAIISPVILFKEYYKKKLVRKIVTTMIILLAITGFLTLNKDYNAYHVEQIELEAGTKFNYTMEESGFLFHPQNHFKKINGYYFFSENSGYWHSREEFEFKKKMLERKRLVYSNGIVRVYSDSSS